MTPGETIADRYRVDAVLGEGGMGVVYAATHTVTRKRVALKVLRDYYAADPSTRQRFLREARAASAVRHPNVVQIHDVLDLPSGVPVMVMELLEGETLAKRLERDAPLDLPSVARILLPVLSAVGTAHELGIVHRDLKPENIFLAGAPGGDVDVKVLDFGIAKLTATEGDAARSEGGLTRTGSLLGTPYYMSPEQMFGEKDIDHRSDVWSLGVVLYECLAGTRPTQAENLGQVLKVVMTDGIPPLEERVPALPHAITELVGRMLSRERADRPADVRGVVEVLAPFGGEVRFPSFGPPGTPRAARPGGPPPTANATGDEALTTSGTRAADADQAAQVSPRSVTLGAGTLLTAAGAADAPSAAGPEASRRPTYVAVAGVLALLAGLAFWRLQSGTAAPPAESVAAAKASVVSAPMPTPTPTPTPRPTLAPAPSSSLARPTPPPVRSWPARSPASAPASAPARSTPAAAPSAKTSLDPGSYQ